MSIQHTLNELRRNKKEKTERIPMTFVEFSTNKGIFQSDVIKDNHHTVWVRTPDGNIINRHKVKHNVKQVAA